MAYLHPAPRVVLPGAEERTDGVVEVRVKGVDALHGDGVVEGHAAAVVVQVDTHSGRVPVLGDGQAGVVLVGVQPVLQTEAPVAGRRGQADEALAVAVLGGDSQVPDALVADVYLPVVLPGGELGRGQDTEEARELLRQVGLLGAAPRLLHCSTVPADHEVGVGSVRVQGQVGRTCGEQGNRWHTPEGPGLLFMQLFAWFSSSCPDDTIMPSEILQDCVCRISSNLHPAPGLLGDPYVGRNLLTFFLYPQFRPNTRGWHYNPEHK